MATEKNAALVAASSIMIAILALATVAWTTSAEIQPVLPSYVIPKNKHPEWAKQADPPSRPYYVPEPTDEEHRLYRCWGYVARGKATGELNQYIVNGTAPSRNTCEGVNRLHDICWGVMFRIYWQANAYPHIVDHLRNYCRLIAPPPPHDHFDSLKYVVPHAAAPSPHSHS